MDIPQYFVHPQEEGSYLQYFLMSCARTLSPLCGSGLYGSIWIFHPNQNTVLQNLWSFTAPLKIPMIGEWGALPNPNRVQKLGVLKESAIVTKALQVLRLTVQKRSNGRVLWGHQIIHLHLLNTWEAFISLIICKPILTQTQQLLLKSVCLCL